MIQAQSEKWVKVKGYEHYEVSSLGRVRKISYLRMNKAQKSGYIYVQLFKGDGHGKRKSIGRSEVKKVNIHRLVAEHFLQNPNNKPQVNHKDGNRLNNDVNNLEWCTASENIKHAYENNLRSKLEGPKSAKRIKQLSADGVLLRIWNGVREAVDAGYTKAKIYGAAGQGHKYRGCYWAYSCDFIDYTNDQVFKIEDGKRIYFPATEQEYLTYINQKQ